MTLSTVGASRVRRALLALLVLIACGWLPAQALADGDPGSDVLLLQNLFAASDANLSAAQQLQLGDLLNATAAVGQPVRVAIIAHSDDLGAVTKLWRKPQLYAQDYLGYELSNTYSGRLLVVMPNGFGVSWAAMKSGPAAMSRALGSLTVTGVGASALFAATKSAVYRLESAAGISASALSHHLSATVGSGSASTASRTTAIRNNATGTASKAPKHARPDAVVIIFGALFLVLYVAFRRGWRPKWRLRQGAGKLKGVRVKPVALLPSGLLLIVVLALAINHSSAGPGTPSGTLDSNADIDQGTLLHSASGGLAKAPAFTLTDERGQRVSLSQYRGKVVILGFIDAECQTICPLTTQAMLDAKRSLGPAGKDVQLLGIDANYKSTQIEDVANYTSLHGLTGQWHFLTSSSLPRLEHVWKVYGVDEKALMDEESNAIDHVAAVYMIDPQGRLRVTFVTDSSYSSIPQFGQLLAQDASKLLPSHPRIRSHYSYAQISGISPTQTHPLPRVGGGTVTLGPGKPHLYLFFATWDSQTTSIGPELSEMNAYQHYAKAHGLPTLTAIDEGSVEPSPQALPDFLKTLPRPLGYPVAIDKSGKVADGYEVEGEPWLVLTSATGSIASYQEVYTDGWPTLSGLEQEVRAALSKAPVVPTNEQAVKRDLAGSPPALAALHTQSAQLLPGGTDSVAFYERKAKLHGYPIVINIWASTCAPCQAEFGLFAKASALYGKRVAFLGADNQDVSALAAAFLHSHPVSYPSYTTSTIDLDPLLVGGLEGTPTTVFISPRGQVLYVHTGQYESWGALQLDIEDYALSGQN
jgi:cytochrome oxidase Cu insertion factor (SCO1/SenC/PrrC family)/thiol-disulfide isomerase/thioredoxin